MNERVLPELQTGFYVVILIPLVQQRNYNIFINKFIFLNEFVSHQIS